MASNAYVMIKKLKFETRNANSTKHWLAETPFGNIIIIHTDNGYFWSFGDNKNNYSFTNTLKEAKKSAGEWWEKKIKECLNEV